MKLLQINTTLKTSATGNIAFQLSEMVIEDGNESFIAYSGRYSKIKKNHNLIRIGSKFDFYWHAMMTRIFDLHGFSSTFATKKLLKTIELLSPDIIHLHNLHGYYVNIKLLFEYLSFAKIPVVWTMHDCWAFTGHCDHFEDIDCHKWKKSCSNCPQKTQYPASYIYDNSKMNYINKKYLFNSLESLTIVPVSNWLESKLKESFFHNYSSNVIHNGIDLDVFKISDERVFRNKFNLENKIILLGVASKWSRKKGFFEFLKLSKLLDDNFLIVLVGTSSKVQKNLPSNILGLPRIHDQINLADIYSSSDLFINLSFEDSYPTTNLEAISCGLPVITYMTGGSPESVEENGGYVVDKGNIEQVLKSIHLILNQKNQKFSKDALRKIALKKFDNKTNFSNYLKLYKKILEAKN